MGPSRGISIKQTTPGLYHGYASHTLSREVEAGSYQDFTVYYTVGDYGLDDSGSLKLCWRFACDLGPPQLEDATAPNYVCVETDADCELHFRFDPKGHTRPWGRTIYVRVQNGYLNPGDQIRFRFGAMEHGTPGIRFQTFAERGWRLRLFVDDVATYVYNEVRVSPSVDVVPGQVEGYRLYLPTTSAVGQSFSLKIVPEDRWANPTAGNGELNLHAEGPISNLPAHVILNGRDKDGVEATNGVIHVGKLTSSKSGVVRVFARLSGSDINAGRANHASSGECVWVSNPLVVGSGQRSYWGDLHGQSGETIGTGTIEEYFAFARDKACLDFASHQGNDFQITREFWQHLQSVTAAYLDEERFVTFPGYEWSGNTAVGGDRNVFFRREGEHIRRSSHALCPDLLDASDDCTTVEELFGALGGCDCMLVPHVGGRYADLSRHDRVLERSVEVHSAWGTFEWMLHDALRAGYRVGVVCTSDGHKGRPGASHPGSGKFGSYGGLTCVLSETLNREAIWQAYQDRHHYGTTGARVYLSVQAYLERGDSLESAMRSTGETPRVNAGDTTVGDSTKPLSMGDIVLGRYHVIHLAVRYVGTAPIYAVDLYNGLEHLERIQPNPASAVDRRILVWWSGSAERGRGRHADWTGGCTVSENSFEQVSSVNFHNPDSPLEQPSRGALRWRSITTGGVTGFVGTLKDPERGTLRFKSEQLCVEFPIESIGVEEQRWDAGGVDLALRIARLSEAEGEPEASVDRSFRLYQDRDNAFYVRVIQEDGTMAWSSPIYIVPTE